MDDRHPQGEALGIISGMLVVAAGSGARTVIGTARDVKRGAFIRLRRAGGRRHFIPLAWVRRVEGHTVHLDRDAAAVRAGWLDKAAVRAATREARGPHGLPEDVVRELWAVRQRIDRLLSRCTGTHGDAGAQEVHDVHGHETHPG